MAQKSISVTIFSIFLLVLFLNLGESAATEILETWCVPKPSSNDSSLMDIIEYACSHVEFEDCNPIRQVNNPCYTPNSLIQHASFAMNIYYQKKGRHQWNCYFASSALISLNSPRYDSCIYKGGETSVDLSSVGKWCVANPAVSNDLVSRENIEYACSYVDCSLIKIEASPCYKPNYLINHASIAMNLYYQETGKLDSSCDFGGSGLVVMSDPSYDGCKFEFRR